MSIDNNLVGSVLNSLPMDRMIAGPLQAMIQAQTSASKAYADFLLGVCIQDGKAVAIQFDYDETIVDEQGEHKGTLAKSIKVPLLAAVTHPNIAIEEGRIEFEMTIDQASEDRTGLDAQAGLEGSIGWGPFKLNMKGSVSHKSEQTRKTDTRARYAFNTTVRRQEPPEALQRVIGFLTDAATKPTLMPGEKLRDPGEDAKNDPKVDPGSKSPEQDPENDQTDDQNPLNENAPN